MRGENRHKNRSVIAKIAIDSRRKVLNQYMKKYIYAILKYAAECYGCWCQRLDLFTLVNVFIDDKFDFVPSCGLYKTV